MNITISRLKEIIIEEVNKINEEEGHPGVSCDEVHPGVDHDTHAQLQVLEEEEELEEDNDIKESFSKNTLKNMIKEEFKSLLAK